MTGDDVFYSNSEWIVKLEGGIKQEEVISSAIKAAQSAFNIDKVDFERNLVWANGKPFTELLNGDWGNLLLHLTPQYVWQHLEGHLSGSLPMLFALYRLMEASAIDIGITPEAILAEFGKPPWDVLNRILAEAALPFQVSAPPLRSHAFVPMSYNLNLKDCRTGKTVSSQYISSGEKVLVTLSVMVFMSQRSKLRTKLFLMDEPDAHLHPQMVQRFLNAVKREFVDREGSYVLLTTHSPTTVALVEEDSIRIMVQESPIIRKASKSSVMNQLTAGVPTLSLNWTARRQVFVENPIDGELCDGFYRCLKSRIESDRTLDFIGTGIRRETTGDDVNTGSSVVRSLVENLTSCGNQSVFGLVDWDGCNQHVGRMVVMGHERRHSNENVVLDPLAIAALMLREPNLRKSSKLLGDWKKLSYSEFLRAELLCWQSAASEVAESILNEDETVENVEERYCGDFKLQLPKSYFHMRGHDLEGLLLKTFPPLLEIEKKRTGNLRRHLVQTVYLDKSEFIPRVVLECFQKILLAESHF